jgi:hypothetical protein
VKTCERRLHLFASLHGAGHAHSRTITLQRALAAPRLRELPMMTFVPQTGHDNNAAHGAAGLPTVRPLPPKPRVADRDGSIPVGAVAGRFTI